MFKPKCLIQPINEIYSSKKKKNPKLTACGVRAACLNKTKKSPNFLNSWIEKQRVRERERENPKPKSWKLETVTTRPSLNAALTPADCCCRRRRRSVTPRPRAIRSFGSVLKSGMFLFFFFLFFFFFSFPVFLFRFCYFTTLDNTAYLFSCLLISCLDISYLTEC